MRAWRDHGRVDHQAARRDAAHGVRELVDVGHALLEQVARAVGTGLDERERARRPDVRREDENPDRGVGVGTAELPCRP